VSLIDDIKTIQRAVGAAADGIFGPRSAAAVLAHLARVEMVETQDFKTQDAREELDERTLRTIATLDAKAQDQFLEFMVHAKAIAATLGCDYVAISGTRTWDEQAALYKKYKAGGPKAAPPGYSWHNYGTAIDCGVFRQVRGGQIYCDDEKPELASKVHAACSTIADAFCLEWGGDWKGRSCDPPHYQINTGRSTPNAADRAKFQKEGSVL
jgi:peptidoglycan L-alanyl-D-glutamate endopeptidase CwlK